MRQLLVTIVAGLMLWGLSGRGASALSDGEVMDCCASSPCASIETCCQCGDAPAPAAPASASTKLSPAADQAASMRSGRRADWQVGSCPGAICAGGARLDEGAGPVRIYLLKRALLI